MFVCDASELPGVGARPLPELVGDAWDLSSVAAGYRQFIDTFMPVLALLLMPWLTQRLLEYTRELLGTSPY